MNQRFNKNHSYRRGYRSVGNVGDRTLINVVNDRNNINKEKPKGNDLKAFLNVDPNNSFIGGQEGREPGNSRFRQWFKPNEDPLVNHKSTADNQCSSLDELCNILNATLCDESPSSRNQFDEHNVEADTEKCSPSVYPTAANGTGSGRPLQKGKFNSKYNGMSAMLQAMPGGVKSGYPLSKQNTVLITNVEELEVPNCGNKPKVKSDMCMSKNFQQGFKGRRNTNTSSLQLQEKENLKKLLEQLTSSGNTNTGTSANVLNAALQGQPQRQLVFQQFRNHADQEEQIQRNTIEQKRLNELLMSITNGNIGGKDVSKSREFQLIVESLIRGVMTQANLRQQLAMPTIPPRYREAAIDILNYLNLGSRGTSPMFRGQQILSPNLGQQQQGTGQQSFLPEQQQYIQYTSSTTTTSVIVSKPHQNTSTNNIISRNEVSHPIDIIQSALNKTILAQRQENYPQELQKHQYATHQIPPAISFAPTSSLAPSTTSNLKKAREILSCGSKVQGMSQQSQSSISSAIKHPIRHGGNVPQVINQAIREHQQATQQFPPLSFTPTHMTAKKDITYEVETAKNIQANDSAKHPTLMPSLTNQLHPTKKSKPRKILGCGSKIQTMPQQIQSSNSFAIQHPIPFGGNVPEIMRNDPMKWNQISVNQLPDENPIGCQILSGGPIPSTSASMSSQWQTSKFQQLQHQQSLLLSRIHWQEQRHMQQLTQQHQYTEVDAQSQQFHIRPYPMQQRQPGMNRRKGVDGPENPHAK